MDMLLAFYPLLSTLRNMFVAFVLSGSTLESPIQTPLALQQIKPP
jgi:hypothetical protein